MRFKPSQGIDGNYIGNAAPYHGPNGAEPVSQMVKLTGVACGLLDPNAERPFEVPVRDEHDQL